MTLLQRIHNLEGDRELLVRLVSTLRETDNHRVLQLLSLIRSNSPLEEVKTYMNDHLYFELKKTPELADFAGLSQFVGLDRSEHRSQRRILDVNRLADIPLWKVPAKPWTNITDDDDFVSHLMSLWFTWTHPYMNWIDRDLFIRDMQLSVKTSNYCSPFLVNIILADACVCESLVYLAVTFNSHHRRIQIIQKPMQI